MISPLFAQLSSIPNDIKDGSQRASVSAKISSLISKINNYEEYLVNKDDINLDIDLYKLLVVYENTKADGNSDTVL